jgi:uncharacterized membrane protein
MPELPVIRSPRWAWWVAWPLTFVGLGISIYLAYEHFTGSKNLSCPATTHIDCAKVTTSSQSEIFNHIPVALVGLIYFSLAVILMSPWSWRAGSALLAWLRIAFVVGPMGMVVYLVYVEAVQLKAICLWCTGVHIVTFLLFLSVLAAYLLRPLDPIES